MPQFTIYHNPRCSKSRQTLELLTNANIEPEVILYLDQVPTRQELKKLLQKLGLNARQLLRTGEAAYKKYNLANVSLTDAQLIDAMLAEPKLIERPIVVKGQQAVLGRPPESVLRLL